MKKLDDMVAKFKQLLLDPNDMGPAASAFFDLTETDEFLELGKRARCKELDTYLPLVSTTLFNRELPIRQHVCLRVKKYKLYHGSAQIGPHPTTMVYCESLEKGFMAVYMINTGEMKLLRITPLGKSEEDRPIFIARPAEPATD